MNKKHVASPDNQETISDRLRYLIDKVGIKQVHLANKLGVTPQAIHQLCNGKQNFSKHTQHIARLLNADETWLQTGQGTPFQHKTITTVKDIREFPVYQLAQLNQIKGVVARLGSLIAQEIYVTARAYNAKSLCFYVADAVFAPRFDVGDIMLIEPIAPDEIKNGLLILVYSHELNKTVLCYSQKIKNGVMMGWQPAVGSAGPVFFTIESTDFIYGVYRECLKTS